MAINRNDLEMSENQAKIRSNEVEKQISQIDKKSRNAKFIKSASYVGSHGGNILSILIIILIGVAMIRILYNGSADTISFGSFLDLLQNVQPISTNVKNFTMTLQFTDPWVVLDGLRVFLNSLSSVVSILIWMASSLIDVVQFIAYFLMWIFV